MLSNEQRFKSADSIEQSQLYSGLILWFEGGHSDPWNHVEAAIALDTSGRHEAARRALNWLSANQLPDGSWHQYYNAGGVEDQKFDANTIAYVAVGAYHHWLSTGDDDWLRQYWPTIYKALNFVLELQQPTGEVFWAREPDGTPFHYALVTGSSSIHHSLHSAVEICTLMNQEHSRLREARDKLAFALTHHEREFFAEKDRWAMDWYYPVLGRVLTGDRAQDRLLAKWDRFYMPDGIRCVDDHPWVTTGETAEAAVSMAIAGLTEKAHHLHSLTDALRHDDGSYSTGLHIPSGVTFPENERTTYSTAAVLIADSVLRGDSAIGKVYGLIG